MGWIESGGGICRLVVMSLVYSILHSICDYRWIEDGQYGKRRIIGRVELVRRNLRICLVGVKSGLNCLEVDHLIYIIHTIPQDFYLEWLIELNQWFHLPMENPVYIR